MAYILYILEYEVLNILEKEYSIKLVFYATLKDNPTTSNIGLIRFKEDLNIIEYSNICRFYDTDKDFKIFTKAVKATASELNKQLEKVIDDKGFSIYVD